MVPQNIKVNLVKEAEVRNSGRKTAFINDYSIHKQKQQFRGESIKDALKLFNRFKGNKPVTNTTIENGGLLDGSSYLAGWDIYMSGKNKNVYKEETKNIKIFKTRRGYIFNNEWTDNKIQNSIIKGFIDADYFYFLTHYHTNKSERNAKGKNSFIDETLKCLSGKWKNDIILTQDDYERLLEYTRYTFTNKKLPDEIVPITGISIQLPIQFVKHTYYLIWKEAKMQKDHTQELWIRFLKKVFPKHFKLSINSYQKKFAEYRKNYEQDLKSITY